MDFEKLKSCLRHFVLDYHTPGVDCLVYKDHEQVFRYTEGVSDLEKQTPMNGLEIYYIFSMTKMLTCTAALQLLEQGKYELEDPISKFLPEFGSMRIADRDFDAAAGGEISTGKMAGEDGQTVGSGYAVAPITVQHLFTMSAGLDYDIGAEGIRRALARGEKSTRALVGAMAETVLGFEPGTRFRYSLCHDVLGALIEVWSGQSFGTYLQEHICKPLGMEHTCFGLPAGDEDRTRMAQLYFFGENRLPVHIPLTCPFILSEEYESGGAGLTSCTADYGVFLDALACGGVGRNGARILSEKSVALMAANQMTGRQVADFHQLRPGYGYGLGVRVHMEPEDSGSLSPVGEFGWDGAAGAFAMVDPVNRLSMVYFQHVHNWDLTIQNEMRNALYADLSV